MRIISTAAGLAILLVFPRPARAVFQEEIVGARAAALGSAFAAGSDDASSLFLNPAGLARAPRPELRMMYAKPNAGADAVSMNQGSLALAVPGRWGAAGIGATTFMAENLVHEYRAVLGCALRLGALGSDDSSGRARRRPRWRSMDGDLPSDRFDDDDSASDDYPDVLAGLSASYLYHSYPIGKDPDYASDPAFAGGVSKGAVGVDAGLMLLAARKLSFGLAVKNVNRPDLGISDKDRVARDIQAGARWDLGLAALSADVRFHQASPAPDAATWHFGVEIPLARMFTLRLGAQTGRVTGGFGLRLAEDFSVDYATQVHYQARGGGAGTHQFELGWRFGGG